jgi:hypothetical protein
VLEIVVEKVFTVVKIEVSSGPYIDIFQSVRHHWHEIDSTKFETAGRQRATAAFKDRAIDFAVKTLTISQPETTKKNVYNS